MGNLFDDLVRLQAIPHAHETWAEYRKALSAFIVENTRPGTEALIVGAGPCNDLNLPLLLGHFSRLTLLDRNPEAMARGLTRQGIPLPEAQLLCQDLVGIPDDEYRALADDMLFAIRQAYAQGKPDLTRTQALFLKRMEAAFAARQPGEILGKAGIADYVICCGVHSQLLTPFPQMAAVYGRYGALDPDLVEARVKGWVPPVVAALDDALFSWAKKGVILGLEAGPIEGAWQAMEHLKRQGKAPAARALLPWPFDPQQGKAYEMNILCFDKG